MLAISVPIAWGIPERHWPAGAELLMWLGRPWRQSNREHRRKIIGSALGDIPDAALKDIDWKSSRNSLVRQLQVLRAHRPDGWRPQIAVEGREYVAAGLAQGRGVILWIAPFQFIDLVTKMATHQCGFAVTHLSSPNHGWSTTQFGRRFLNPVLTKIESRFLGSRLILNLNDPKPALGGLRQRLMANCVVSITALKGAARRPATVPVLGLGLQIGLGAPVLAYDTGAALLPVFALQRGGNFRVVIEPPIAVPADLPRGNAAIQAATTFGVRLEPYILAEPTQWEWWHLQPITTGEGRGC